MTIPPLSPTPSNLLIGAGELYLARIVSGVKQPWRHIGNSESITLTTEDEVLDKFSSMDRARPLYARRLQRRTVTVRVQFDEYSKENMALILMGANATSAQAATPVVGEVLYANVPAATLGAAAGGASFKFASYGAVTAVTVELGATPLVLGTDYTLDSDGGVITILAGSTIATSGTDDLTVDYTPTAFTTLQHIRGGVESFIEVAGLFIPDPSTGPKMQLEWWRGSVSPDGDLGFISEEYAQTAINVALQEDRTGTYGGSETYPTHKVTYIG